MAVAPNTRPAMYERMCAAVLAGGGTLADLKEAEGLVWADPANSEDFPELVATAERLQWVQLPYAGVEPFAQHLDDKWTWTCGKGVYAPAVAETVMALLLAGFKNIHGYARSTRWSAPLGRRLTGANVTILGGGGIARCLIPLLKPFECDITIIRRSEQSFPDVNRTMTIDQMSRALPDTDILILALALTSETIGIIDAETLALLPNDAWLINVARGRHVVTSDLTKSLEDGLLGGAALDVTDPEPLPEHHPLWALPNCIVTPHIANTPEMGLDLLEPFVAENVRRFCADQNLLAVVDVSLGY